MLGILIVVFFLTMFLLGLPLFGAIVCAVAALPLLASGSCPFTIGQIADWAIGGANYVPGIPIILFIISGALMSKGKLTQRIFDIFNYFFGAKTGFMPIISILTAMFYSAISGSATAVAAAVGGMCLPLLVEMGYDKAFCAVILMCAGVLGFLIPPSTPLTGGAAMVDLDVMAVYRGGTLLGVSIGLMLIVYAYIYCMRHGNGNPEIIRKHHEEIHSKGFAAVFKESIWALLSPIIILGGIFSGLFTVAQAAVVSVIYGIIVSVLIYKSLTWKECLITIQEAIKQSLPMVVILMCAIILSSCLTNLGAAVTIANAITSMGLGKSAVIIIILLAMTLLGAFMDSGAAMAMMVPIVVPVAAAMGINPYPLFVAIVGIQSMGLITPPFGLVLFMFVPMTGLSIGQIVRRLILPFLLFTLMAFLFALVPALSAWVF